MRRRFGAVNAVHWLARPTLSNNETSIFIILAHTEIHTRARTHAHPASTVFSWSQPWHVRFCLLFDQSCQLTVPTVGRFRASGIAFLTTDRIVFCASKPHGSQNGECLDTLSSSSSDFPPNKQTQALDIWHSLSPKNGSLQRDTIPCVYALWPLSSNLVQLIS